MKTARPRYLWQDLLLVPLAIDIFDFALFFKPPMSDFPKVLELLRNSLLRFAGAGKYGATAGRRDSTKPARVSLPESQFSEKNFLLALLSFINMKIKIKRIILASKRL